jgi:outer membrane protein
MLKQMMIAGCIAAAAATAQADVLGVRAGAYRWHQNYDGTVRSGNTNIDLNDDLGFDDENANVYYIAIDHPIPILPNLLLQHTDISATSTATLRRSVDFDGALYPVATGVRSELDLSHTDATFYYRPLDNWVKLRVGLTVRKFDKGVKIRSLDPGAQTSVEIDGV